MTQRSGTAGAQSLAAEAREFTARMAPDVEAWELARHVPESELRACAAQFAQLLVPQNRGGLEATCETAATVLGELAKLDLSFAFSMVVHANLTNAIARYGSEALIERYLTKMLRGEVIGAFCLTEPQAGTDAGAITTSVTANSDGWLLNGCKAWVTNGVFADLFCVYARDRNAGEPSRASSQIGAYLLDGSTRGLRRHEPYQLLGSHLMGTTGLDFESCRVPADGCLFNAGDGFRAAMRGIDLARVLLSSMCCAVLRQAIEEAVVYVKQRRAFGQAIGEFQAIQFQLANMATQLEAAESLTKKAAVRLDAGQSASVAAAHAKKFATEAAVAGIGNALRMFGAAGLRRSRSLARQLTNANTALFLDGTSEVQNIVIARDLLND